MLIKEDTVMDTTSIPFRSHTALLLAASLPHLQPAYRQPAELALKFLEFSETLKCSKEFHLPNAEAQRPPHKNPEPSSGLSGIMDMVYRFVKNPEGLLHSLSQVCTGKEKEIVNLLLQLMQAKSFYENYGDLLQGFMSANKTDDHSTPDIASMMAEGDLSSMLNQEQTNTLNLLKSLLDEE